MAYTKLKQIIERKGIEHVARSLNVPSSNLRLMLDEMVSITINQAKTIQHLWAEDYTLDELFQSDGNVPSESECRHAIVEAMGNAMREACPGDPEIASIEAMFHDCVNEYEAQHGGVYENPED